MHRLVVLFSFLIFSDAGAQVLEGMVFDAATEEVLPYVNVNIKGTSNGTVSKSDGSFHLGLNEEGKLGDSIIFSMIGYQRVAMTIEQVMEHSDVKMTPRFYSLEALVVSPKSAEEYIKMAVDNIPDNYIGTPYNALMYFKTIIRLNGVFIESSEALVKGYIMPVTGEHKDSTRLVMLAFRQFDEEEKAIRSIMIEKKKSTKPALDKLDSILLKLNDDLSAQFGIYYHIDSNLIKEFDEHGYEIGKDKYRFESAMQNGDRTLLKIGFKGKESIARKNGSVILDEGSLAFEQYTYRLSTSSMKLKMLLLVLGIGFNSAEAIIQFSSVPSENGWIPDMMEANVFVDFEKNRLFAKDIPVVMEIQTQLRYLEITQPATDPCKTGKIVKRKKSLRDQFKSEPGNELWKKYESAIQYHR